MKGTVDPSSLPIAPGVIPLRGSEMTQEALRRREGLLAFALARRHGSAPVTRVVARRVAHAARSAKADVTPIVEARPAPAGRTGRARAAGHAARGLPHQSEQARDPNLIPTDGDVRPAPEGCRRLRRSCFPRRPISSSAAPTSRCASSSAISRSASPCTWRQPVAPGDIELPATLRYQACDEMACYRADTACR